MNYNFNSKITATWNCGDNVTTNYNLIYSFCMSSTNELQPNATYLELRKLTWYILTTAFIITAQTLYDIISNADFRKEP